MLRMKHVILSSTLCCLEIPSTGEFSDSRNLLLPRFLCIHLIKKDFVTVVVVVVPWNPLQKLADSEWLCCTISLNCLQQPFSFPPTFPPWQLTGWKSSCGNCQESQWHVIYLWFPFQNGSHVVSGKTSNHADFAFIILTILFVSQNGQVGQIGQVAQGDQDC